MAAVVVCSSSALDSFLPSKTEELRKAFVKLDDQRAALASCMLQWKEVEAYLSEVDSNMQKRLGEICEKEKAFDARVKDFEAEMEKREDAFAGKERSFVARIRECKDSAIAELVEEKRKWMELLESCESEASVKKSAGLALDATVDNHVTQIDKETILVCNECVSSVSAAAVKPADSSTSNSCVTVKDGSTASSRSSDAKLRQHLKDLCEEMDGDGLRKYMVERRKDVNGLRNELPIALKSASDAAALVLGSLEGYYFAEQGSSQGEKESRVSANRRACILLLECLCQVLAHPTKGPEFPVVPSNIKERAQNMADLWKTKMNLDGEALSINSLDAQAFLQLVATFGVTSEYNEDELCKLVTAVARRRQTPALCRSLGLTARMPDIVDQLASDGKQMEAISLAHAFNIMNRIQPGPLLKAYLKEAKKSAQSILKTGSNSPAALNDSTTKELSALKNVLRCIEEFDLESELPSSPLQKRVVQLEKTKSDRKRVAVAVKAQAKRPRANTITTGMSHAPSGPTERTFYRPPDRPHYGVGLSSYSLALTSSFDRRNPGSYSSAYATGSRNPIALPPASYLYTSDGLASSVYGSAAYANPPSNYGSYQFGSGLPPPAPAYQAPFLH